MKEVKIKTIIDLFMIIMENSKTIFTSYITAKYINDISK